MDEGGLNVGSLTVDEYLSKLHSKVIYADCAGEEAYIPSLHHNRLVNMDEFLLPILTGMFKKGEPIKGPDGAIFGYDETEKGRVKITAVQRKMSIAMPIGAASPEKGLVVRLPLN